MMLGLVMGRKMEVPGWVYVTPSIRIPECLTLFVLTRGCGERFGYRNFLHDRCLEEEKMAKYPFPAAP
jgi:hypothetical protein